MFISDFAIKRPLITVVAMVALVVFGIFALLKLQTDEFPDIQPPVVGGHHRLSGRVAGDGRARGPRADRGADRLASAAWTAQVHRPAPRRLRAVHRRSSTSRRTSSEASQDIRDAISAMRADLPTEMKEPILTRFDPTDRPIVSLDAHVVDAARRAELTRLADPGDHARAARRSRAWPR